MKRVKSPASTIPKTKPATRVPSGPRRPASSALPATPIHAKPPARPPQARPPRRHIAHIIDDGERSLVDVLDSLLNQGVVLNADVILALADVDLVYLRLSALLCAADRVLPRKP